MILQLTYRISTQLLPQDAATASSSWRALLWELFIWNEENHAILPAVARWNWNKRKQRWLYFFWFTLEPIGVLQLQHKCLRSSSSSNLTCSFGSLAILSCCRESSILLCCCWVQCTTMYLYQAMIAHPPSMRSQDNLNSQRVWHHTQEQLEMIFSENNEDLVFGKQPPTWSIQ